MKTFIIAELGINHNGNLSIAKKMIDECVLAKVNAVKFQKRDVNIVYSKEMLDQKRESPWGRTQREQKEGLEFSESEYDEIDKYCKQKGIEWFASAWDLNSLNFLKKYNLKYNKVASPMIVDQVFLEEVAKQKKYTFISTGMCSYKHIDAAVKIFRQYKCEFELMHCISAYPFDDKIANLNLISELRKKYNCKVGYSGHEKGGLAVSYAAVALNASSLERHFTLDRTMYGSDQAASISKKGLVDLVGGVRSIEKAINGSLNKEILEIEIPIAKKLRAHIKKKK